MVTTEQIILLLSQQVSHCAYFWSKGSPPGFLSFSIPLESHTEWHLSSQCFTIRKKKKGSIWDWNYSWKWTIWFDALKFLTWCVVCIYLDAMCHCKQYYPKAGPSERPEAGNTGTTFKKKKRKEKEKLGKPVLQLAPHITPVLPPYMAPTTG